MHLEEAFSEFNIEIKLYGSRKEIPVKYPSCFFILFGRTRISLPIYTFKDWLWSYPQNTKLARSANVIAD